MRSLTFYEKKNNKNLKLRKEGQSFSLYTYTKNLIKNCLVDRQKKEI